ncbi:hypothetical protein A3860_21540 [Niastella vici]|uniref:tRNA_anti-like n=1 Tax=Niastella vici TaxID=1703345 RepID=A0A1V9G0A6_9BACT|nr:hypothetical protein [Niastella vici]OQP64007.1 hypothetical protein A3860_21540 [Niastella vici]
MRTWKKIITGVIVLALAAAGYGWFLYQKPPPDIRKEKGGIEITAIELLKAFQQDEMAGNAKYVDKVLIVSGIVNGIQTDSSGQATVTLRTNDLLAAVTCSFYQDDEGVKKIKTGAPVRIKGICTGMLSDIVLNKCSLAE